MLDLLVALLEQMGIPGHSQPEDKRTEYYVDTKKCCGPRTYKHHAHGEGEQMPIVNPIMEIFDFSNKFRKEWSENK